uniref:Uncharacterized protein n=1 Tax=Anopheles melas TaxID=34690 RepID=A0A182TPQ4_9DIPT
MVGPELFLAAAGTWFALVGRIITDGTLYNGGGITWNITAALLILFICFSSSLIASFASFSFEIDSFEFELLSLLIESTLTALGLAVMSLCSSSSLLDSEEKRTGRCSNERSDADMAFEGRIQHLPTKNVVCRNETAVAKSPTARSFAEARGHFICTNDDNDGHG